MRYKLIDKNNCKIYYGFNYLVVDKAIKHDCIKDFYHVMCECFTREDAETICSALNNCLEFQTSSRPDAPDKLLMETDK